MLGYFSFMENEIAILLHVKDLFGIIWNNV